MTLTARSLTLVTAALGVLLTLPTGASAIAPTDTYLLPSATAFDGQPGVPSSDAKTVTLPLSAGLTPTAKVTWYVVTESSDAADARRRGVNYAPKLARALGTSAVQTVRVRNPDAALSKQIIQFAGTVDFSPDQQVVPGAAPDFFPPSQFAAGSVADATYSPLISTGDGIVLDAPQVANASGLHDTVLSADFAHRRVTVGLFEGFYEDHPVLYTRFSGSDALLAAIEATTFTPNLNAAPGLASDDPASSSREAIVPIVNGPTGPTDPQRQGLNSALAGEGAPLNIIQEEPADPADPSSLRYSPLWDVTPGTWTTAAITAGQRTRLTSIQPTSTQTAPSITSQVQAGALVSAPFATGPLNPSVGLNAAGVVSLCPVVAVLPIRG